MHFLLRSKENPDKVEKEILSSDCDHHSLPWFVVLSTVWWLWGLGGHQKPWEDF